MIKNFRNGLLSAAITLLAVGCDGRDNIDAKDDDPLADKNLLINLINGGEVSKKPTRAIAQLFGDTLSSLIGQTTGIFDTLATVTNPSSNAGKILGSEIDSTPSAAVTQISADCSNGGNFTMDIQLDILKDGEGAFTTPNVLYGLTDFPDGVVDIALGVDFDMCNEPKHTYDGDEATAPVNPDATQMLDGRIVIRAKSDNKVKDASGAVIDNDKDFLMSGSVSMKDYFIQTGEPNQPLEPVELITGEISFTLLTTDYDSGIYKTSLGLGVTIDNSNGGSTRASISANGTLILNDQPATTSAQVVLGYNLSITNGYLSNVGGDAAGQYDLFTQAPLVSNNGKNPSAGMLAIIDKRTGLMHTAKMTDMGVTFNIYEEGTADPVVSTCTWEEINKENDKECLAN